MKYALVLVASAVALFGCSSATPSDAASDTVTGDAGLPELGEMFVAKHDCGSCHNPLDASQGLLSGNTEPVVHDTEVYAANLTPDIETGIGSWSDDDIARAIRDGFAPGVVALCPEMSHYSRMGDYEARAIIAYLRQIPAIFRAIPGSICPPIKPKIEP